MEDEMRYHATQAWLHLSHMADHKEKLELNAVSTDILYKAIMLTHILSGGEDVREIGSEANT